MKKIFLLIILITILKLPGFCQTVIWQEDFATSQGWFLQDNWTIELGKMEFYWSPSISNFNQSALSPMISIGDNVDELIITQNLDVFSGTGDEFAEIAMLTATDTTAIWEYNLLEGTWGAFNGTEISFPMEAFSNQEVRIRFRTYGLSTFNWNWWDVFEIKLTSNFNNDLCVHNISGPGKINILQEETWTVDVKNLGLNSMSNYTVKIFDYKTGDILGSILETDELSPGDLRSYDFSWMSYAAYNTVLYGAVVSADDQFSTNNSSKAHFLRITEDIPINILVWDNDNGIQTVTCPEQGDQITPAIGLTRALVSAGLDYDYYTYLPDNLDTYDIVFATMGCFCLD
ncbi:MAG: hypothetical protein K9H58_12830 [Bacteroidales bacterium]|nr:hypothetical protein [Bacteroidales bacterium]